MMKEEITIIYMIGGLIISLFIPFITIHLNYIKQKKYEKSKKDLEILNSLFLIKNEINWNIINAIRIHKIMKESEHEILNLPASTICIWKNDAWNSLKTILIYLEDKDLLEKICNFYNNLNTMKVASGAGYISHLVGLEKLGLEISEKINKNA